ncbi:hypothetical protein DL764_004354 [Monosporascus ibericus]|uniref:Carrier domain-containing protein n=1 Tax=Monosporascus ibericus TaxID=155417 RepID=A0A4Q4TGK7_9PEZI|nr:hypothetical protein DL764_004354 [Monosporascus ibericus]
MFDLGITSFNLITLQAMLEEEIEAKISIPMSVVLVEPTVGVILAAIEAVISQPPEYNPTVPLQPHGLKTPLFCIHPGSRDILMFIALAARFSTRPVYAIRTRKYNPDEGFFHSIKETADTYAEQILKDVLICLLQPRGCSVVK